MPSRISLTKEQMKEMLRLRVEEKMPFKDIGRKFGVSAQIVERRITELGFDPLKLRREYQYDRFFFYETDSKAKAYWLGFTTADGFVSEDQKRLVFHLQWGDHEHLEKFIRALQGDLKVRKTFHSITGNPIATLEVNGSEIVEGLLKQGVHQGKSGREIPPQNVPEEFIPDYLRGLWDGDGHIAKNKIDLRSSFEMCSWVQQWLLAHCDMSKVKIGYDSNIYRLYLCRGRLNALRLMYYPCLDKEIVLDRKYKQAKLLLLDDIKKSQSRPGTKIA